LAVLALAGCGAAGGGEGAGGGVDAGGGGGGGDSGGGGSGSGGNDSYLVYAHSDHVLYSIDLSTQSLITVGTFSVPDVMTDLAVAPDGTIYVISYSSLFTASPVDGHVTKVGSLATCGQKGIALTTTADGRMWVADYMGAICQIDLSSGTPVVKPPVMLQNGLALSGDMVGVGNGSVFGSAYMLNDPATQTNNILVEVDVATGAVTQVGATGYPRLYGVAFQQNKVFGFTHDGSGRVVTIDTVTGAGTMFGTFMDPTTNTGIAFAGAGVNSLVPVVLL
jgi:hypothetical protein